MLDKCNSVLLNSVFIISSLVGSSWFGSFSVVFCATVVGVFPGLSYGL